MTSTLARARGIAETITLLPVAIILDAGAIPYVLVRGVSRFFRSVQARTRQ